MRRSFVLIAVICLVVSACHREAPAPFAPAAGSPPPAAAPAPVAQGARPRIVFLGDSLTAGLGLDADQSFPALIEKRLASDGLNYEVVNAGVSGDTSAGGLRRVEWSLDGDVKVLVVALGANDGLRGLAPAELKRNLAGVLDRAAARGVTVILAGMEAPPNFGADYTRQFRSVYTDLAQTYRVRFVPFLLQGVAGDAALNQADGIHPNARGAQMVADLLWAELKPVLARPTPGTR
ncbi:MAG: arylesterase [Vicinamibacterales bacterium]|jgi:acyl-CoA thioesterase-1